MSRPNPIDTLRPRLADQNRHATRHIICLIAALFIVLVVVATARMFVGPTLGWPDVRALPYRIDRLVIACIVGVALSVSGVALQSLLRNPLAEPFILGLSTGAGVGVMGQLLLQKHTQHVLADTRMGALAGSALTLMVVFFAGRRRGVIDPLGLLLVGVVIGTINGGLIMFLNYVPGSTGLRPDIARWMMGWIMEETTRPAIYTMAAITGCGLGVLCWKARALDVAAFSDAEAQSVGVNLARLRVLLFVIASVLAACAVMLAGPIAFVGLICPHLVRRMLGPGHGPLLIGSALAGATLLLLADMTSYGLHLVFSWGIMPLGIFTAMLGGVFFLWILRTQPDRGLQ